jgi:apolipoprotein N-acyltransferase
MASLFPSLLTGILLGITTIGHGPVYHFHWAIFFGFVPLWALWTDVNCARKIFLSGWVAQFIFTLIAFHWLAYTINEFSHMGMVPSILLAYCAVANIQFPLAGLVWHCFFRRNLSPLTGAIALALLTALLQRLGTTIFHWNFGYAWLYMGWPGIQLADIFGFRFLCTFSILLNALFLISWKQRKHGHWKVPLSAAVGSFLLLNLAGFLHEKTLPPHDSMATVMIIQPNIGNREKEKLEYGEAQFRQEVLKKYMHQTSAAIRSFSSKPTFVLWPENAFPAIIADSELSLGLGPTIRDFLRSEKINLLTGGFGLSADEKITNSIFALSSEGKWASLPYHKMHLLPFGEYVPGAERFPILKKWLPDVRDYGSGDTPILLDLQGIKIGPQICYEGLFDSVSRDLARLGAEIIVNVTNDSWYGDWMEPWQHYYITMAKAVETRRPIIRGTNTGISGVADSFGKLSEESPVSKEWANILPVPYRKNPLYPPFLSWGFYFDWLFLAAGIATCLALASKNRRHNASAANQ